MTPWFAAASFGAHTTGLFVVSDPLYRILPQLALTLGLICAASFILTRILRRLLK